MEAFLSIFKALSNETRWRILELLKRQPLCVNALACQLKVSQPAVSQHLKILEHVGLVQGEKIGLQVHYALVPERLEESIAVLRSLELYDSGKEEVNDMCREKKDCECAEDRDPKECTPEQIAECHPEGGHPCEEKCGHGEKK